MIDARFTGHEFHEELNYSISYPSIGDCLDRYIPRFNEIIESCRIIYGLLVILLSRFPVFGVRSARVRVFVLFNRDCWIYEKLKNAKTFVVTVMLVNTREIAIPTSDLFMPRFQVHLLLTPCPGADSAGHPSHPPLIPSITPQ